MSFSIKNARIDSKENFADHIRATSKHNHISLMDSITSYCMDTEIPMENIIQMIDKSLKEEIRVEAINNRMVPSIAKIKALF